MTPLHIAYAFDNRVPSAQADTEQLVSTVAALARRGLDVTLMAPRLGDDAGADEVRDFYGVEGDFRVSRYAAPGWPRVAQKLWAPGRIALSGPARRADLVHTRNLPVALGAVAAGRRTLLDTYRPWPDQVPALRPLIRWLAASPRFVGAALHSELARDAYLKIGVPADRLLVAHNGWEPARMKPELDRDEARRAVGLETGGPAVVYTGRISADKGLGVLLETARRCPDVRLYLVGATGRDPFEDEARRVANVELVPWQPFEEAARWLYAADVLVLPPSEVPLEGPGDTVLPMKLFSYLAAGRPILAGRTPDVAEILTDGENARLVPPGSPEAAAEALRALVDDGELARRLSRGARRTAGELTWDARARRIHDFVRRRLEPGRWRTARSKRRSSFEASMSDTVRNEER